MLLYAINYVNCTLMCWRIKSTGLFMW